MQHGVIRVNIVVDHAHNTCGRGEVAMAQQFSESKLRLSYAIIKHLQNDVDSGSLNSDQTESLEGNDSLCMYFKVIMFIGLQLL